MQDEESEGEVKLQDIYNYPADGEGWRTLPDGRKWKVGTNCQSGNGFTAGDGFEAGNGFTAGDGFKAGDELKKARERWPEKTVLVKWVTPDRQSPNFDGGTKLTYPVGAVIEVPEATISDQQCGVGLHVFLPTCRPEWFGYCSAKHNLIPIHVEVRREDVCFPGYPGDLSKIRVRKLVVLD